jgi:hypothetical protein
VNQGIEERCTVTLGENEALMSKDGCLGRFGERGEAEVGQAAPLEGGGALDEPLGFGVYAEAQPVSAGTAFGTVDGCGLRHELAPTLSDNHSVRPMGEQSKDEDFGGSCTGL